MNPLCPQTEQERYATLAPLYYRGASAAAVVFDITKEESFTKAKFWVKELQKHASASMVRVWTWQNKQAGKEKQPLCLFFFLSLSLSPSLRSGQGSCGQ